MAKLLQLIVLAAAATVGLGSGLSATGNTPSRTGVSFTLDSEALLPLSQTAKAKYPGVHRVKATGMAIADAITLEAARGILHLADSGFGFGEKKAAASTGAALFELAAQDPKAKAAIESIFRAPGEAKDAGLLERASNMLHGAFRGSQLRSHAKAIEAFATGVSSDRAQYEKSREKIHRLLKRFRKAALGDAKPIPFELLPQWREDISLNRTVPAMITKGRCYPSYAASSVQAANGKIDITIAPQGQPSSATCAEQFVFIAGGQKWHLELFAAGSAARTVSMDVSGLDADSQWFLNYHGVRAYIIATDGILATVGSALDTLTMLMGFAMLEPPQYVLDANLYFINEYVQGGGKVPRMGPLAVPRPANNSVVFNFDPANIQSGDLFMLLRRDGIDPMIGWGEGSMGGHSVVAIRTGPNPTDLQACESTTLDGYWPDNGIQCHTWDRWVELCVAAGQNVVLVPLSEETRKTFDTNKAIEFFNVNKGLDYGYSSFLFGWLDTYNGNFPCTPSSNYTTCLMPEMAEQLAILLDSLFGSAHDNFFRQALAHRTNQWTTSPDTTPSVMATIRYAQTQLGKSTMDLIQIIEKDEWLYQTTRDQGTDIVIGKSMVCCVFVCNMWKAGGIFDSLGANFTCAEQTLWDLYSMKIFDEQRMGDNRPQVCKTADPTNPLCQLMGDITMHLVPDVNTRSFYPNMGEKCAALPPQYIRPDGC